VRTASNNKLEAKNDEIKQENDEHQIQGENNN
jgi:hypothetical protein